MASRRARPHPLVELTRARVLEFVREPEAWFWTFVFPVLLAIVLGIAFRSRPHESLRVAVENELPDRTRLAAKLATSSDLEVHVMTSDEARRALVVGRIDLVVGRSANEKGTAPDALTFRLDPARIEARTAKLAVEEALSREPGTARAPRALEEHLDEPGSRYIDYLIPGLIGLNLMGSGMWGLGFAIVQARVAKLLKRFAATPMRRLHFLLSFMLSRLLWLIGEVAVLAGAGMLIFGLPMRGSLLALATVSLLGSVAFAGLGLLVAARPQALEGVSGLVNLVQLPMWLFSGTFFSYLRFPEAVQPVIRVLPLTALNDALRNVILEGRPLVASSAELMVLSVWTVASFAVALRSFRWQ